MEEDRFLLICLIITLISNIVGGDSVPAASEGILIMGDHAERGHNDTLE